VFSPGTSSPDKITWMSRQFESSVILLTKYRSCSDRRVMKGVLREKTKQNVRPHRELRTWRDAITVEHFSSGNFSPLASALSLVSLASLAVQKRPPRCWFIFARGATPFTAMEKGFLGLTFPKRSAYAKMDVIICSSESHK
jgi:hypothetical protein